MPEPDLTIEDFSTRCSGCGEPLCEGRGLTPSGSSSNEFHPNRFGTALSLHTIARTLGLSVTTVSRALGGYADVAVKTRALVVAEAARIGYRPNATARRLRVGRSEAVGVVLPTAPGQFDDPFFLRLLTGLSLHLARRELDVLVTAAPPGEEVQAYRRLVEGRRVDAFVIARTRCHDARIAYLLDQHVPFVAHGRTGESRRHSFLDVDGAAAFTTATRRLIDFGHRRIAMVNAPSQYTFAAYRAAGWRAALAEAGLREGGYAEAAATEETAFAAVQAMLAQSLPPTAIVCATDRIAAGALHAISLAGLRAGQDISVIGYDNLPAGVCSDPPLTTMDQMVDRAAERLVDMLAATLGGAPPETEIWQAVLVPRGSDGPIRKQPAPQRAREAIHNISGGRHAQGTALG
jgi:LacI family transcriptional regulator